MNNITTLRDIQDQDAAIEYWLESDRIGTLCREGRTVYYATLRAGTTVEGATREDVARELYRYHNEPATASRINRAIRHTGLRVRAARAGSRYLGYAYFVDGADNQVGESVMVYRLKELTLERWVAEAERALYIDPQI